MAGQQGADVLAGSGGGGCARQQLLPEVRFGVPLTEALKGDGLPIPLVDMLVYIAKEGVTTTDLFRRPGNPNDSKLIMKRLAEGKEVIFTNYNFYTLASVLKKFLLKIPGGIFGEEVERQLLAVLEIDNRVEQYEEIHRIITSLPAVAQQLLALLFGTWFRIVNHSEFNTMSSEAVAKSVAGSLFHTCADDPHKIERAVQVLIILIDDFGVANMFGRKNLQYFANVTRTGIRVKEKFRYDYQYPAGGSVPLESTPSVVYRRAPNRSARPMSDDKSLRLFALVLQSEAHKHGFDTQKDAISEAEYYGRTRLRSDTQASQSSTVEMRMSSPPSPQSLQPQPTYKDADNNPHKKLQHMNSLSAPEVNKGYSPTQESLSPNKRIYQSSSLSRFDNVRKRQILRMKKRSNWFLGPTAAVSLESSRETSVGKSSLATSSEALMSDMTASDLSADTPVRRRRCSSDVECGSSYLDEPPGGTPTTPQTMLTGQHLLLHPSHQPHHFHTHHYHHQHHSQPQQRSPRLLTVQPDVVNGNHSGSGSSGGTGNGESGSGGAMARLSVDSSPRRHSSLTPSPTPSDAEPAVSEHEVRYFMVENWYASGGGGVAPSTPKSAGTS